jgi:hypothetical protein
VENDLHHDVRNKVILCSDDWGKYWADMHNQIEMDPHQRKHGYRTCKHVHIVKYSCKDHVAFEITKWRSYIWGYESSCPATMIPDGGRAL